MSAKVVIGEYKRIHKIFLARQAEFYAAKREYDTIDAELGRFMDLWSPVVSAYRDAPPTPPGRVARFFGAK